MTHRDDDHERLEELLREVETTRARASELSKKGRELTEAGQAAEDTAALFEGVARSSPDGFFRNPAFDHVLSAFREFNDVAFRQSGKIDAGETLIRLSHQLGTSTNVSSTAASTAFLTSTDEETPELKRLNAHLHRTTDVVTVLDAMKLLGLDSSHGSVVAPSQLLMTAQQAFKKPFNEEGYQAGILLPLRESIQSSISELLKKRLTTEKASTWTDKITSIGR